MQVSILSHSGTHVSAINLTTTGVKTGVNRIFFLGGGGAFCLHEKSCMIQLFQNILRIIKNRACLRVTKKVWLLI